MLFELTNPEIAILMMSLFLFAVLLGFPIAFTLLAMGVGFGYYAYFDPTRMDHLFDNRIFSLLVSNTYTIMDNTVLTAVPLFLFMRYLVERAGIVAKLFFAIRLASHRLPASMAVAALVTCALFSTATGIIGAVVTLMGLLAWPAMIRAGYDKKFASGVICSGGCLGILIPPSIMLIVYAVIAQLSPLRLFAAAIFPGLMLAGLYILYVIIRAYFNPSLAPKPAAEEIPPRSEILKEVLVSFVPLFSLIILVLGTILAGLATPAEAAAVGAFGALVLSYFYKSLKWKNFKESVFLTAKTSAMIMWLFVGSWTFASVFSYLGGHEGLLAWPAMIRAGYDKKFASGVICSGGCLGILIPPSIMLIVYAVIAQLSPLRLFAAAIFPGLMLAGLYILYVIIRAYFNPSLAPKPAAEEIPPRSEILKEVLVSFVPLFSLIILVLGTILAGLATPAEAAAVGAFGALVLSYFYKSLKWKNFKESVFLTAKTSAMIMWLFVGSWTFASVFSYLGGHEVFEHFFKSMDIKPWQFLVITQIIIFLLGWPLEWTEILIIFVPIFLPLVEFFGVNPYFFAMLIALNLQTSFLTPPMAMSAYYLKGVQSRNVQLMEIFRGIMPFLGIVILAMVLMYMFPGIALWLPDTLFAE